MYQNIIRRIFALSLIEPIAVVLFISRFMKPGSVTASLFVAWVCAWFMVKLVAAIIAEVLSRMTRGRYALRATFWADSFNWPAKLIITLTAILFGLGISFFDPIKEALGFSVALGLIGGGLACAIALISYLIGCRRWGLKSEKGEKGRKGE